MLVSLRNLLCIKRPVSNSSHIRLLERQTGIRDNADNAGWLQGDGRFPRCRVLLDGDLVNHHGSCSGRTAMRASALGEIVALSLNLLSRGQTH